VALHTNPEGHEFPSEARHPTAHLELMPSHTRPESKAPQSESTAHPQVWFARQSAPLPDALQLSVRAPVHSTQVFEPVWSQIKGAAQSSSVRHWTQALGWTAVLQRTRGAPVQSASVMQGSSTHVPMAPV